MRLSRPIREAGMRLRWFTVGLRATLVAKLNLPPFPRHNNMKARPRSGRAWTLDRRVVQFR